MSPEEISLANQNYTEWKKILLRMDALRAERDHLKARAQAILDQAASLRRAHILFAEGHMLQAELQRHREAFNEFVDRAAAEAP